MPDPTTSFEFEIRSAILSWSRPESGLPLRLGMGPGYTNVRIPDDSPHANRIQELKADLLAHLENEGIVLGDHRIIVRAGRVKPIRRRPGFTPVDAAQKAAQGHPQAPPAATDEHFAP